LNLKLARIAAIGFTTLTFGVTGVAGALAQAATPPATPSILASAGLPELHVSITDAGFQGPAEAPAGLTYVSVDNQTDKEVDVQFALPPAGTSLDSINESAESEGFPDWFYQAQFAGGPYVEPHAQGGAAVDLTAGDWIFGSFDSASGLAPVSLKVTGDAKHAKPGALPSDAQITMHGYKFDFPDQMAAGPQVWQVTNEDAVPHFISLVRYDGPETITEQDVRNILMADMGTPVPDMKVSEQDFQDAGYVPVISQNETTWAEMNLQPGTYIALCFVSDEGSQVPHAAMGMFDIFTVPGNS